MMSKSITFFGMILVATAVMGGRPCVKITNTGSIRPGMHVCCLDIKGNLELRDQNITGVRFDFIRATGKVR